MRVLEYNFVDQKQFDTAKAATVSSVETSVIKIKNTPSFNDVKLCIKAIQKNLPEEIDAPKLDKDNYLNGFQDWISSENFPTDKITSLDLAYTNITNLPDLSSLIALKILNLMYTKLTHLPTTLGNLTPLEKLQLNNCNELTIRDLSEYSALKILYLNSCENLTSVNLTGCFALKNLYLTRCYKLTHIEGVTDLTALDRLDLQYTTKLTGLDLKNNFPTLKSLFTTYLKGITGFSNLEKLGLFYNQEIIHLDLKNFISLKELHVSTLPNLKEINGLKELSSLKELYISEVPIKDLNLSNFAALESLYLIWCEQLTNLKGLTNLTTLKELSINSAAFNTLPDFSKLTALESLCLRYCEQLTSLPTGLEYLTNLKNCEIKGCSKLKFLDSQKINNKVIVDALKKAKIIIKFEKAEKEAKRSF